LVGTGFAYQPELRAKQAALLETVLPSVRDIRRGGSAALDLCSVACGRLDGYYEFGLQPWDASGGSLVVAEAGGAVATLGGGPSTADTLVAAAPHLAGPLRDLLVVAGAAMLPAGPTSRA
jgi:fructose-1,6-bisphosphatase/inositol monophosphatase family enzyme